MLRLASTLLCASLVLACKTSSTEPPAAPVAHEGQEFSRETPEVDIAQLIASPSDYKGKTIRLSGNVIAMCHHKRDWFALVPTNGEGANVRVLTGPVFKVPEDAIGKQASAEGTVDVVEISQRVAQHFAEGHDLGDPQAITGPVQQVVVRATGAQFE